MHITTRTRRRLAAVAVVPLLAGAACSDDSGSESAEVETLSTDVNDEGSPPQDTGTASAETVSQTESTDATTTDVNNIATTSVQPQTADPDEGRPTQPLAVRKGNAKFPKLRIIDFRRDGRIATLEFEVDTSKGDGTSISVADLFAAPQDRFLESDNVDVDSTRRNSVSGVTLIDQANLKRHLVLRDERGDCLCTVFGVNQWVGVNSTFPLSAQFPAPPTDVTTMSVDIPNFPVIDNVPLREAGE